jgi:hypothetical protein
MLQSLENSSVDCSANCSTGCCDHYASVDQPTGFDTCNLSLAAYAFTTESGQKAVLSCRSHPIDFT